MIDDRLFTNDDRLFTNDNRLLKIDDRLFTNDNRFKMIADRLFTNDNCDCRIWRSILFDIATISSTFKLDGY